MVPGTSDPRVVSPARRQLVSQWANPVVARGVVAGAWTARAQRLEVSWFTESGRVPRTSLEQEAATLATFVDRPLDLEVELI
jgi:hypothetical protein